MDQAFNSTFLYDVTSIQYVTCLVIIWYSQEAAKQKTDCPWTGRNKNNNFRAEIIAKRLFSETPLLLFSMRHSHQTFLGVMLRKSLVVHHSERKARRKKNSKYPDRNHSNSGCCCPKLLASHRCRLYKNLFCTVLPASYSLVCQTDKHVSTHQKNL